MTQDKQPKWYVDLVAGINAVSEELGLDDLGTERIRTFVLTTAKAQYLAGNRAGIYWAKNGKNQGATA